MAKKKTKHSQSTCPQCGAPLNRNSFVLECSYCGYVDVGDVDIGARYEDEREDEARFCNYIVRQWPYITQVAHVDVSQQGDAYYAQSRTPYYANNGDYELIRDFSLRLCASFSSTKLNLGMDVGSEKGLPTNPYLCIVVNGDKIVLKKERLGDGHCMFRLPYDDFEQMCGSEELQIVTNCSAHRLVCDEFLIYCRRFFHAVFDRTQYAYSLSKGLLTD